MNYLSYIQGISAYGVKTSTAASAYENKLKMSNKHISDFERFRSYTEFTGY